MNKENFTINIPINYEDRIKIDNAISILEDICPSDSNLFFILEKSKNNKLNGELKLRSFNLKVDIETEAFDIDNLIDILNLECTEKIKEWRRTRVF